jgi:hypothetical protein
VELFADMTKGAKKKAAKKGTDDPDGDAVMSNVGDEADYTPDEPPVAEGAGQAEAPAGESSVVGEVGRSACLRPLTRMSRRERTMRKKRKRRKKTKKRKKKSRSRRRHRRRRNSRRCLPIRLRRIVGVRLCRLGWRVVP